MKAILIGRHTGAEIPGIEIVDQQAITWPATSQECAPILDALLREARQSNVAILFQAVPGQLARVLCGNAWSHNEAYELLQSAEAATGQELHELWAKNCSAKVGIIVSKPGARPAGVTKSFAFAEQEDANEAAEAVRMVNPNVELEWVNPTHFSITVDPQMKFEFSHVEWL